MTPPTLKTIYYAQPLQTHRLFNSAVTDPYTDGNNAASTLVAALHARETNTIPPCISQHEFAHILSVIGPTFFYYDKAYADGKSSDCPTKMVLCRLPMKPFDEQSLINTYRLYVVPYNDLLFYRSLLVDIPIQ